MDINWSKFRTVADNELLGLLSSLPVHDLTVLIHS